MTQITEKLMKIKLRQVIFMGCPTFKLSYHRKGFSSNSFSEILDSNQQVLLKQKVVKMSVDSI